MGISKICLTCVLAFASLHASSESDSNFHALYMVQNDDIETALRKYQEHFAKTGHHDFEILQRMGLILFQQGIYSEDPTIFTMTLFGAGLSGSLGALEILEKGLFHPDPQIQLIALHFISKIDDDQTDILLNRAMSSEFLSTRMEAAFYMAQKKHPLAVGQIEGLMHRLPPVFYPFFPSLFALIGTSDATQSLCRLLDDIDPQVRIESILNIARLGRDDLLPLLRRRLTHSNISELEACAFAIGTLKDSSSLVKLKKLSSSPNTNVKIAAILALHELGDRSNILALNDLAKSHNIFAINALGNVSGFEDTLFELTHSSDLQIRLNASIALLQRKDERCIQFLEEILITDARDLAFYMMPSIGRTLLIWKAVPSAELRSKDPTIDLSLSLSMREQVLREAIYLPQESFLRLARNLIDRQQNDLIPCLMNLLENLRSPEAIALLKYGCEKISAPLIRDYCHLALFRLKDEGFYSEYIKHWIMHQKDAELIRLRPLVPWKTRLDSDYTLSPEETSRLLVDAFMAVAADRNIDFLIEAILRGNPQNRYALFGLLMRATE